MPREEPVALGFGQNPASTAPYARRETPRTWHGKAFSVPALGKYRQTTANKVHLIRHRPLAGHVLPPRRLARALQVQIAPSSDLPALHPRTKTKTTNGPFHSRLARVTIYAYVSAKNMPRTATATPPAMSPAATFEFWVSLERALLDGPYMAWRLSISSVESSE